MSQQYPLDPEELQRRLGAMREGYRSRVPGKIAQIEALWGSVLAGAPGDEARAALVLAVHTMVGSAPTLGCEALGAAARELEAVLRGILPRHQPLTAQEQGTIQALIAALGKSIG